MVHLTSLIIASLSLSNTLANPIRRQTAATTTTSTSPASSASFSPVPTSNVNPPLPAATDNGSSPYPTVTLSTGTRVIGRNPTRMYDEYLGVPFAAAPTASLRFSPPQPPSPPSDGTITAQQYHPACAQTVYSGHQTFQDLQGEYGTSEDCLYLNVVVPSTAARSGSGMPVLVFLPGGNFYGGAASAYDGSIIGQIANTMGMPFIQVTLPYRLGVLGWPAGRQVAEAGAANLGMRDAMMGMQWVKENIAAFGGDPSQITAAGQSAGGAIISLLYLRPDIDLFRSAIVMSAPPSLFNLGNVWDVYDGPWNEYVAAAGCTGGNGSADSREGGSVMECLKAAPLDTLLRSQTTVIDRYGPYALFGPSIDFDLIKASPFQTLNSGAFANKPILMGTVKDEGTTFVLPNLNSTQQVVQVVQDPPAVSRSQEVVSAVLANYPADPSEGSPFGSGNETFGFEGSFKRAAAIFGDAHFQAPRRHFMQQLSYFQVTDSWAYMFEQPMPESLGIPPYIGTGHHSDTIWSYGRVLTPLYNYTENDQSLSLSMMRYFINFIDHSDPNTTLEGSNTVGATPGFVVANSTQWTRYAADQRNMLQLLGGNITIIRDDFREEALSYFISQAEAFRY